jgi:hypothetical protein
MSGAENYRLKLVSAIISSTGVRHKKPAPPSDSKGEAAVTSREWVRRHGGVRAVRLRIRPAAPRRGTSSCHEHATRATRSELIRGRARGAAFGYRVGVGTPAWISGYRCSSSCTVTSSQSKGSRQYRIAYRPRRRRHPRLDRYSSTDRGGGPRSTPETSETAVK